MLVLIAISLARALEPDLDGDGWTADLDCDDLDASVNPDAVETCDDIDDDCDGFVDDDDDGVIDQGAYLVDADGDGLGVGLKKYFCTQPVGYCVAWAVRDCDDTDASIGMWTTWHPDEDGDGYGSSGGPLTCDPPSGYVTLGTDCDDGDPARNPSAVEVCNGVDDNCDGLTDDADPLLVADPRYVDGDEDGYGDDTPVFDWGCATPSGYVEIPGDCDDASGWTHPGAPETCDGQDEDCDGAIDDDTVAVKWFADADGDGHGVGTDVRSACAQPPGYARAARDCDDAEPTVFPDAPEVCNNGVDDNCDGGTDNCWLDAEEEVDFSFVGDEHYSYFGAALDIADVDADGNADLLVGAWNSERGYGAAYVLNGPREFGNATLADADQTFTSSYYWDGDFGSALGFGDANGDGAGDLLVGAPGILPSVALFLGPTTAGADTVDADAFFTAGELWFTQTGASVDVIPDHDGDGVDDLLVGAPGRQLQRGVVFVVSGDVTGTHEIEDVASHRYRTSGLDGTGQSLAALDQDGDGLSDLLIGAPRAAAAFLIEGGVPAGSYAVTGQDDATFLGNLGRDNFGWDVASGDLDDDGYADAIVTAPSARTGAGATSGVVYAFLGPLSGTTHGVAAEIRWEGIGGGGFGASVATGEDVDGDGETDTIIGDSNGYGGDTCTTYLQRGHTRGVVTADQLAAFSSSENDALGSAVAFVPDWNGDGLPEIAAGAPLATDSGVTGGAVRVFWSQHFVE